MKTQSHADQEFIMISSSCDLMQFLDAVQNKDYYEIIYLADKEATEAWRLGLRGRKETDIDKQATKKYADMLKSLISYLRYEIKPRGLDEEVRIMFDSLNRQPPMH